MISALQGKVVAVRPEGVVQLECGPVTLELNMPRPQALDLLVGETVHLATHLHFVPSADQLKLFAFADQLSRDLFAVLISASGVGPRVALGLLELGAPGLVLALSGGDEHALTQVSGVGAKLAKKVIVELGEKVGRDFASRIAGLPGGAKPEVRGAVADALDAVVTLGFPRPKAEQALSAVRQAYDGEDTATLIRRILAQLSQG